MADEQMTTVGIGSPEDPDCTAPPGRDSKAHRGAAVVLRATWEPMKAIGGHRGRCGAWEQGRVPPSLLVTYNVLCVMDDEQDKEK